MARSQKNIFRMELYDGNFDHRSDAPRRAPRKSLDASSSKVLKPLRISERQPRFFAEFFVRGRNPTVDVTRQLPRNIVLVEAERVAQISLIPEADAGQAAGSATPW